MQQHSIILKKYIFVLFAFSMLLPVSARGQMFSVGNTEEREPTRLQSYSIIGVAWEIADFNFTGSGVDPSDRADFENSILRLRFENPGLNISAGFGGSYTGMERQSYINLNALLYNDFPLLQSPRFILALPIQITTDLKSVQLDRSENDFSQSSFVIGTGASLRYRIGRRAGLSLRATPNLGFSFSRGALFGGRLFTTTSQARLYFNDIIGSNTLSFGYDFDYRDYNIEGSENDYRYLSHAITIGIAF